ncbi:MAG: hypothetical protein ACYDAN_07455, partial [Candidatus Limnocylindrales bacterium]
LSLDSADVPLPPASAPPSGPPLAPHVLPPPVPTLASAASDTLLPTPSAVGRPASRLGWVGAFIGVALFLAATVAALAAAGQPDQALPAAHWDRTLRNPDAVSAGQPFDLAVEAANPDAAATDRLWLIVDWRANDGGTASSAAGRLLACVPADCEYRNDPAAGVTVVVWSGLPAGSHRVLRVTLVVDGLSAGQTLTYRVTAGSGAAESRLREPVRWTVAKDVQ